MAPLFINKGKKEITYTLWADFYPVSQKKLFMPLQRCQREAGEEVEKERTNETKF